MMRRLPFFLSTLCLLFFGCEDGVQESFNRHFHGTFGWFQQPLAPVSNFDVSRIAYADVLAAPDGWNPDMEMKTLSGDVRESPWDSIRLTGAEARAAVTRVLDGHNYETAAYLRYHDLEMDGPFGMAMCFLPRLHLTAYDSLGRETNLVGICFECGNAGLRNGVAYPASYRLPLSKEGRTSLRNWQDGLFPQLAK